MGFNLPKPLWRLQRLIAFISVGARATVEGRMHKRMTAIQGGRVHGHSSHNIDFKQRLVFQHAVPAKGLQVQRAKTTVGH